MASKTKKMILGLWAILRPTFSGWMRLIPPFYENQKLVAPLPHIYKSLKHIPRGIKIRKGITNRLDILMTGGVKKSHLRKAHPVRLLEVRDPGGILLHNLVDTSFFTSLQNSQYLRSSRVLVKLPLMSTFHVILYTPGLQQVKRSQLN